MKKSNLAKKSSAKVEAVQSSGKVSKKQNYTYTALIAACLLLLGTMVWIQGETINSLQGQIDRVQAHQATR